MALITRGSIQKQLRPGLNAVFGMSYKDVNNEHLPLFDIENSMKNYEEEVLMTGFELAPTKAEGQAVEFDDAAETYTARYVHETIALAFGITQEAMEDEQYQTLAKMKSKALGRAMANTKQTKAANIFNLGFSQTYGDGVALFSASHPTRTAGNQSNTGSTDLSETAIETAVIAIATSKDDRGVLIGAQAQSIHVSPSDLFNVQKILGSEMSTMVQGPAGSQPGVAGDGVTNTNKINVLYTGKYFPKGYSVNHRFTDTNAWFIRTDVANGTKMFVRKPLATSMEGDWDTDVVKYKARERYSFGVSDFRGVWGSNGST